MAKTGKSISVDDLAIMVGKGFKELSNDIDGRFKRVDERFDHVEARLVTVEEKVNLVRADIAELRYDYKKVITRIENLELKAFGSVQEA
jgi:septation ring formation regulator EzrA